MTVNAGEASALVVWQNNTWDAFSFRTAFPLFSIIIRTFALFINPSAAQFANLHSWHITAFHFSPPLTLTIKIERDAPHPSFCRSIS